MHELSIAQEILEIVERRAGGTPVLRVILEVGRLTAVLPDALRFAFEVASEGTIAQGASLDIVEVRGRATCRACGATSDQDEPWGSCACGSLDLDWIAGNDLRVKAMEVS